MKKAQASRERRRETMEFEKRKAATLAAMESAETDKSPKGTLDEPILTLLKTLNHHPSYFTTSSCSGRISIFSHPAASTTVPKKSKGGSWLFISHEPADPNSVLNLLFPSDSPLHDSTQPSDLVFRFEPFILAVECRDVGSAQFLVSLAISCGFRESGITSVSNKRVIIAVRCSIRLEVPLGSTRKIMVSKEYARYLVELANEKMAANRRRTDGFLAALSRNGFAGLEVEGRGNGVAVNETVDGNDVPCFGGYACGENREGDDVTEIKNCEVFDGSLAAPGCSLHIVQASVVGEHVERLFLWGHSSCPLLSTNQEKILVFGGFGGIGRHARRNDCLLLDASCGALAALNVKGAPSPRMGHTCQMVGYLMFVIGGRADPANVLGDVWVLDTAKNEWRFVECAGSVFAPRHRHAAAVLGSKIYIFGGLNDYIIYSSLLVLDVEKLQWKEVHGNGEWPCARHSHSLAAHGSKLYLFGGYDGEKALGDLYSFDPQECRWEKVQTAGKAPFPRFSHSMFVYKDYLGIIGGCPIRQHGQELAFLDLQSCVWRHMMLNSAGSNLFVRSTANVAGEDLIVIGGGASCYAFGSKFSELVKINLLPLMSQANTPSSSHPEKQTNHQNQEISEKKHVDVRTPQIRGVQSSDKFLQLGLENKRANADCLYWVLQLERKNAKLGKDILKKFGWLDLKRKVYFQGDGSHICFPVTEKFFAIFQDKLSKSEGEFLEITDLNQAESHALSEVSHSTALNILAACGVTKLAHEVVKTRKASGSYLEAMREAVALLLENKGLPALLLDQLPTRWERLGDVIILPVNSFRDTVWNTMGNELWHAVARSFGTLRLARQGRITPSGTRDSGLELLVGDDGWVEHRENGIVYSFDATKCMFSWGNLSEKLRMAQLDCTDEVIVDLFAGIGYFVLPFLVRSNAKMVYACEWNVYAVEALRRNLQANSVSDRCIVLEGDNRLTTPSGIANRVCLGLLPSSEGSWVMAVRALRSEGGTLHVHGNVKDSEEDLWTEHVVKSISKIAKLEGRDWKVFSEHVERVKWYAPHIRHVVVDVICKQSHR